MGRITVLHLPADGFSMAQQGLSLPDQPDETHAAAKKNDTQREGKLEIER